MNQQEQDETREPNDKTIIINEKITKKNGEVIIKKYSRGKVLGKGGFATCYEITDIDTEKVRAAKIISKSSLTRKRALEKLLAEIKIHKSLQHENIVRFEHVFEDKENVYMILELCPNQTLKEFLKKRKRLTEAECAQYVIQILNALRYLHAKKIIHRDLKLGNLFLGKDFKIKVGDFGLAAKIEQDGERRRTICGTPNYIAPEVLDKKIGHSYEVDTWSLGVIIYTLLIGRPPFETNDTKATYRRILKVNYTFPSTVPISDEAKELIKKILILDPAKRLTIDEILEDPFIKINMIAASLSQLSEKKALPIPFMNEPIQTLPSERAMMQKTGSNMNIKDPLKTYKDIDENDIFIASSLRTTDKPAGSVNKLKTFDVKENEPMHIASPISVPNNKSNYKENRGEPVTSDLETFVVKWADYSTKYGLGYLLSDGAIGILFSDHTKLTFAPHGSFFEYVYKQANAHHEVLVSYSMRNYPAELQKKVHLTKYFESYLTGNECKDDLEESIHNQQEPGKRLIYLKKYMKTKYAVLMRLSNKIVQVDFTDNTRIILDPIQQVVYYRNKEEEMSQYPLFTALDADYPEMVKRLKYTKEILTHYKSESGARHFGKPIINFESNKNDGSLVDHKYFQEPNGPLKDGIPEKLPYRETHAGFD